MRHGLRNGTQHGLLRSSFVPPAFQRELRELTRYRTSVVEERSRTINRLQKILEDTNLKLSAVATDLMGLSAREILAALLAGETNPTVLAELARGKMRAKRDLLVQARPWQFKPHHRLLIGEQVAHIDALDEEIERLSTDIAQRLRPYEAQLKRLETIPGIKRRLAEVILAEIGPDMQRFPSARHLARLRGDVPWQPGKRRETGESAKRAKATPGYERPWWKRHMRLRIVRTPPLLLSTTASCSGGEERRRPLRSDTPYWC
jgi:transposase